MTAQIGDGPSPIDFSVVVCTFNRADLLQVCLETLVAQTLPSERYEIIIVDNNSADETAKVAADFTSRFPHARYIFEASQGLSNARNRGWEEAHGLYVAYVDDECKVPPDWLKNAAVAITAHRPEMLGGPYGVWYRNSKPAWFKDEYASNHVMGSEARPLANGEYLSGGNMFIRREILAENGGFDPRFGMNGNRIAFGEETAFQIRLRANAPGCLIYYDPALTLNHMVRPEKMRLGHMVRTKLARGRSSEELSYSASRYTRGRVRFFLGSLAAASAHFAQAVWHAFIGVLFRDRATTPYPQNYIIERSLPHVQKIGRLLWRFRRNNPGQQL